MREKRKLEIKDSNAVLPATNNEKIKLVNTAGHPDIFKLTINSCFFFMLRSQYVTNAEVSKFKIIKYYKL